MNIKSQTPDREKYFKILDSIALVPKRLYFMGDIPTTRQPSVAIVGSRKPTSYGKEITHQIAYDLAQRGVIIISGLALGVDSIAHRAALEAHGTTLAVLANGLPTIYPSAHTALAQQIIHHHGAIISEYPTGTPPMPFRFLERNRLVSGLADAIIITEAAARSGTLNTAAHALEQGKDIFVVPGNITSPMSAGTNALLKQGASPVTSSDDILEIIAPELLRPQVVLPLGQTPLESNIIALLQQGIRSGDEIQQHLKIAANDFSVTLTTMELNGVIRSLGSNRWTLK